MGTDFRNRLQAILAERSSRYIYFEINSRHFIVCNFTEVDDPMVVRTLIEGMRDNQSLVAMTKDVDYRWEGAAIISFENKAYAAAFYMCLSH